MSIYSQLYDKDSSGTIDLSEMVDAIGTLYDMEGVELKGPIGHAKAERLFADLDADGDGTLSVDEFVKGREQ